MAQNSSIEWTEATWNPVTGCSKISPGCKFCYAERMAKRLRAMGQHRYRDGFQLTLQDDVVELPLRWKKPRVIFVNSMSDLFHADVPVEFIRRCFNVMEQASQHTFQVLTNRPERTAELSGELPWPTNVWMGTSVEDADYVWRVHELAKTGAHIKFLSVEPLLGPIPNLPVNEVDWVIVGGESGPDARPMKDEWVREIRDHCVDARVSFFFKQWGAFDQNGVRRSKKRNGRELDGRTWNELPRVFEGNGRNDSLNCGVAAGMERSMVKKHYEWIPGELPPVLGHHSLAKHTVLEAYLTKYVSTLAARPSQERLKLMLVDGFAGGGLYQHPDGNGPILGSPLIMLRAMATAEAEIKKTRRKEFNLDVEYIFVEKLLPTITYLKNQLSESPLVHPQSDRIHVLSGSFSEHLNAILHRVEQRGRSRRVIFLLDQYGYSDVRIDHLRTIFSRLPNAEVILTIAIDWLIDHWTDNGHYDQVLNNLGLEVPSTYAAIIKQEKPTDWRPIIQHTLHEQLFRNSGASFYTPFFIRSVESHRAYWLLHFSGHSKARDVMTQLHWELENHFQHFGQAGFLMLGFDPRRDFERLGQNTLCFGFDSTAAEATKDALFQELPRRIAAVKDGIPFGTFFESVVNETPATKEMVAEQTRQLTLEKELQVRTKDGKLRRNGVRIQDDNIILRPRQRLLRMPGL